MRMVDLRPSGTPTSETVLTVRASEAAEALRFMGVLVDSADEATYDVGAERIGRLRDRLGSTALTRLQQVDANAKTFHVLGLLAADLPDPAGVDELLAEIEDDPAVTWRLLLGHNASGSHGKGDAQLGERVAAGDPEAIATVQGWADETGCPSGVLSLLRHDPDEHGANVAAALRAIRPVWDELAPEAMAAIDRDVSHRIEQRDGGTTVPDIVLEATNGYALPSDTVTSEVVLLPSYWLRPWIVVARRGTVELLSSVVADEFVAAPPEAPSPALLKLFKALSDEGRLKLLRRMSGGPISLAEACEELHVAKATAHHHLSTLRQAGLVVMRGEGRGKRYALRDDPPAVARDALASYVQPGR